VMDAFGGRLGLRTARSVRVCETASGCAVERSPARDADLRTRGASVLLDPEVCSSP
jgi:hypothetical protein